MSCKSLVITYSLTLEDKIKWFQVRPNHLAVLEPLSQTLTPNLYYGNNDSTSKPKALLFSDKHSNFKWLVFNSQILEHLKQQKMRSSRKKKPEFFQDKLCLTSEIKVTTEKQLHLFLKLQVYVFSELWYINILVNSYLLPADSTIKS